MPRYNLETKDPADLIPGDIVEIHPYICIVHSDVIHHELTLDDGKVCDVYEITLIYPIEPYMRTIIRIDDETVSKLIPASEGQPF